MSPDKFPQRTNDLANFLNQAEQLPQRQSSAAVTAGRLIFALDATASRQPTWDRACQLQGQMFLATDKLGGLQLQLCYYRGFNEFHTSPWVHSPRQLLETMTAVQCLGGYTQLERVLQHCLTSHRQHAVQAVVMIGDAVEEPVDRLCNLAGQLGLHGLPLFLFQEGHDPGVKHCFQQMARLSHGAYAAFDDASADQLAELLAAVATYASGGQEALAQLQSAPARDLLQQLKR